MARQLGTNYIKSSAVVDSSTTASTYAEYCAERVQVEYVAAICTSSTAPGANFVFTVSKRVAGTDTVIPVHTAGQVSIANGLITDTGAKLVQGSALGAYCHVSLDRGDGLVFKVTTAGAGSSTVQFVAVTHPGGAGLIELNDIQSN